MLVGLKFQEDATDGGESDNNNVKICDNGLRKPSSSK